MMKLNKAAVIIALFSLSACGDTEKVKKDPIKPVKYVSIGNNLGTGTKTFNGISKSGSETKLSFRSNGLIVLLDAKNGEKVRKGQVLARLDQKDISLSYDKAKASARSAKSQLDLSKSNLDRIKELYQSNGASLADYEQAKNNYSSAQANYENAVKSMNIQSSQFEYAIIKAPMDGIITQVNADVNEVAQAGNPIFIMNSEGDDLEITVGVPESYISKIQEGKSVEVNINNSSVEGIITEVAFSTGGSLTYSVIVKLINPTPDLRPGMPAEVLFEFESSKSSSSQLLVPVKGVGNDADGDFVFVLKKSKKESYSVHKVHVKLGELKAAGFVVNKGLNKGDLIAIAGLRTLYDGMNVKLLN